MTSIELNKKSSRSPPPVSGPAHLRTIRTPDVPVPPGARIGVTIGIVIALFGSALSTAPLQVAAAGVALAAIILLLWRKNEPPLLLLPPLFQWSEVAIVPLSTIWKGVPLNELSMLGSDLENASLYGIFGVVTLALGLRLAMGSHPQHNKRLAEAVQQSEFAQIWRPALALIIAGYVAAGVSPVAGSARELFNVLSSIKYVGIFLLAYWSLHRRSHMPVLAALVAFEIIGGLTGFFAEFKNSLLTFLVAVLATERPTGKKSLVVLAVPFLLILSVAIFWSAVKQDYRLFVNGHSGKQLILVPLSERLDYLSDKAATFDGEQFGIGIERLISRHGYIDYLGRTMRTVPEIIAHENGAITAAVIRHISVPRFFDPSKPPLPSDTEIMAHYTAQPMVWKNDTSISLGNLAELYVDFGYLGGLGGIFTIGLLLGCVYRGLMAYRGTNPLVTAGLCHMAALPAAYFGNAFAKLIGATVFGSVIAFLFQRYVGPTLLRTRRLPQANRLA